MKLSDLKNGRRYELTVAVKNPHQDGRASDDATRLPMSAGDRWRVKVRNDYYGKADGAVVIELNCVRCRAAKRSVSTYERLLLGWVMPDGTEVLYGARDTALSKFVPAFLDALKLVEDINLDDVLHDIFDPSAGHHGVAHCAYNVLEDLFTQGIVNREHFEKAKVRLDAEYEREQAEYEAAEAAKKAARETAPNKSPNKEAP